MRIPALILVFFCSTALVGQLFTDGLTIDSLHNDFTDVVLIDFDSDGDKDVFAVSQYDSLYYYENLGGLLFDTAQHIQLNYQNEDLHIERRGEELYTIRETFGYFTSSYSDPFIYSNHTPFLTLYQGASLPSSIRIRDLDGDGQDNDLLYIDDNPIGDQIWIQQNHEWPPRLLYQASNYYVDLSDFEVGDFNADGFPDIAICDYFSFNLSIFMGGRDCGFEKSFDGFVEGPPYGAPYPIDMEIIDSPLEGVNQEIILIGFEPSFISRMPVDTNGIVIQPIPEPELNCRSLAAITAGDYNLDGITDIVSYGINTGYPFIPEAVCEEEGVDQRVLFLYDGALSLEGTESFGSFDYGTDGNIYQNHEELKSGDLDGDGDMDLVLGARTLQVFENTLLDCSTNESAPVDLRKNYAPEPFSDGLIDRVQLNWYKSSPEIRYSAEDNAACDIEFWPVRDLITGENLNFLPHSMLEKKSKPGLELWKWPIKFNHPDMMPNTRYKWRVRCYCNGGEGPVSPWSETKFFATPDFDPEEGIYEGKSTAQGTLIEKVAPDFFQINDAEVGQVIIYSLSGQELQQIRTDSGCFSTEGLASGMYIIQLFNEETPIGNEMIRVD